MGWPEALLVERRHHPELAADSGTRGARVGVNPVGEGFRFVEGEDGAAAGVGFEEIGEAGFDAGALVAEREGAAGSGDDFGKADAVLGGLDFDGGEGDAAFLASMTPMAAPST